MTTTLPRATAGDGHNFMPNCGSREGTDSCWLCGGPLALHLARPWNPDPLRPPETDEPSCCELACYEDPGCACDGCGRQIVPIPDDEDSGLWAGVAFTLVIALAALVIGIAIGRLT